MCNMKDNLRKALTYLVDKIECPLFYDQLAKVISMCYEIKASDEALRPFVNKWSERKKESIRHFANNVGCNSIN